jgi:hypothetical protein
LAYEIKTNGELTRRAAVGVERFVNGLYYRSITDASGLTSKHVSHRSPITNIPAALELTCDENERAAMCFLVIKQTSISIADST